MKMRQLGQGGPMVSAISLGCWNITGAYGETNEEESRATLSKALDLGVDFLDTANVYGGGLSEQIIGRFIKDHPNKFKIASKVGIYRDPETNVRGFNNSPEHLRDALEKTLTHLGVDYIDLYYIHRREAERPIEEMMDTLGRFVDEGKIGGIGFSEISPGSLRRAHAVGPVAAVQSEYSLWVRMPELGVIQTCKELDVAFVPFSPLGRGVFAEKTPDPSTFADGDFRKNNPRFLEPNFSYNAKAIEPFKELARTMGVTTPALAIAWVLAQGEHLIPIPGTRSPTNLADDVSAIDIDLSADDLAAIEKILPVGFAHGDRYSQAQLAGAERFC